MYKICIVSDSMLQLTFKKLPFIDLYNIIKRYSLHIYEISRLGKSIEIESGLVVARDWGWVCRGRMERATTGYSLSFWGDEDVLEFDGSDDWTGCEYVKVHFKRVDFMVRDISQ